MKKKITIIILTIIVLVFANGCYYVFWCQYRSAGKIRQGKELSAYEIGSIYTMHLAVCTVGWFFSPEAAKEVIGMSFKRNRGKVIRKETDFFEKYQIIAAGCFAADGVRKRIAFDGDVSYKFSAKERRLALAVNPGYYWKDGNGAHLEVPVHYPKCYNTRIGLPWGGHVTLNECLFSYLEDKGILHPYTIVYSSPVPAKQM